ncbi:DUF3888 domain-containing protein [Aminipila sp.]|uniref:DUF3888 domain-containing protein n=1 Tax=Aminipila sp. TaxID=2060095 RepID=UPI0028969BC1|nr:DUF3888 domain-containing protein [Aminipila sp.]
MLHLINDKKKYILILILLSLIAATLTYCLYIKNKPSDVEMTANMQIYQSEVECNKLLINTYLYDIQQATNVFYSQYYTINPTVSFYVVTVKEIKTEKTSGTENISYLITFISEPYIGPHDTIGKDEITFSANYTGNVEVKEFEHFLSYHLPEHLKDLEKKPLPGEYAN